MSRDGVRTAQRVAMDEAIELLAQKQVKGQSIDLRESRPA